MRWLFLEPYYGGSHRSLVDGLAERLPFEVEVWMLPASKWKWRMHGAALSFAERWHAERPKADAIFTSSMLDASVLRGLLPTEARRLPLVLYFHENQLCYPVQVDDKRDFHYAWINVQSALAADRVLWNSRHNRDSFLAELPGMLARLPDHRPEGVPRRIEERSRVLPVPVEARDIMMRFDPVRERAGPCRILWNHRWEHDKGPELFFDALVELAGKGLEFEVAVLGQRFRSAPEVFARAQAQLGPRVKAWGYREGREDYLAELARCDVAVSTAGHEFQGLAILEAAAAGAVPLVPDGLAYPEIWPEEYRYWEGELVTALEERILQVEAWRERRPQNFTIPYDWGDLLEEWIDVLEEAGRLLG